MPTLPYCGLFCQNFLDSVDTLLRFASKSGFQGQKSCGSFG
ncbi:hypothetical protein [aff. Roholtiella sp. LEGE 12411]|nr:hypothetical protein [aff. Roholtiella sp. LEGE 12411]